MPNATVYIFNGFLDSGKTSFINDSLSSESFARKSDRILLIQCEEGEVAPDVASFFSKNVACEVLTSKSQLNSDKLEALRRKSNANIVIIEYNGTWMMQDLYNALPEKWEVFDIMTFVSAETFDVFYKNMRERFVDQIIDTGFVVFNRCEKGETDELALHKAVRAANTYTKIAYEYTDGSYSLDNIEDPLPFDKEADEIGIAVTDYGIWYRDLGSNMKDYDGKTVCFVAYSQNNKRTKPGAVLGRYVMNCCEADAQFCGLYADGNAAMAPDAAWVNVRAKISIKPCRMYGREGPVLDIISCEKTAEPLNPVATFV